MTIIIKELNANDEIQIEQVKEFLFNQIEEEFNISYNPQFHYDIDSINKYYLYPRRNNLFIAMNEKNDIIATIGLRAYDKNFKAFENIYFPEDTASIWRLFVEKSYRRNGLATKLLTNIEDFAKDKGYSKIYLHTHRFLSSGLSFWKANNYKITIEDDDEFQTIHMIKELI